MVFQNKSYLSDLISHEGTRFLYFLGTGNKPPTDDRISALEYEMHTIHPHPDPSKNAWIIDFNKHPNSLKLAEELARFSMVTLRDYNFGSMSTRVTEIGRGVVDTYRRSIGDYTQIEEMINNFNRSSDIIFGHVLKHKEKYLAGGLGLLVYALIRHSN